jgi:hypothetical protein
MKLGGKSTLEIALIYADTFGWLVFPCKPWPDKSPYTDHGWQDASRDPAQITKWWNCWPDALVGLPTGVTTVVVLDIDAKKGSNGFWTLADDFEIYDLPETPQVFTPSGGVHLYFDAEGRSFRGTVGAKGRGIGSGLDWRSDRNYVILPSGDSGYAWHSKFNFDTVRPLPVPSELLPREPERIVREPVEPADGLSPYARAALNGACRAIVTAPSGEQEATLNGESFALGTLAGAGGHSPKASR